VKQRQRWRSTEETSSPSTTNQRTQSSTEVLVQRQLMTSGRLCRNNHSGPNKVQQHQICPRRRCRIGGRDIIIAFKYNAKSATEAQGKCSTTVCSSTVAAAQQQRQQKCSTTVCSSTAAAKCSTAATWQQHGSKAAAQTKVCAAKQCSMV